MSEQVVSDTAIRWICSSKQNDARTRVDISGITVSVRGFESRLNGWAVVLTGGALTGVTVALTKSWLPAALAAGLAAAAAIVAAAWTSRGTTALTERDKRRRSLPGLILLNGRGRLPRVRDLDDPVVLGAHPASTHRSLKAPAFIARDIAADLDHALKTDRFVLIVGDSTAGKTRAAYEAMRCAFPGHRLIQPAGKEALAIAIETARETPTSVLWLDDLERFLGADGLTGAALSGVLDLAGGTRQVLATMRAEEFAKYTGRVASDESPSRDAIRRGWEVLRLATRLTLRRSWSVGELERAARHRDDPRITEALKQSDRFGVAEYLAAGPQLLVDLQDAWAPGTHPRAAALVLAAVDARRVGIHRPLSLSLLQELHEHRLREQGGQLLRPEPLDDALAWATTPLHATSSLLLPADGETYLAFDYLIDAVDKKPIPAEVLTTLLTAATPEEAMEIGEMAWSWHHLAVAEAAFGQAEDAGHMPGLHRRTHLIRERDGSAAGLRFARRTLIHHREVLGPDHPDTIDVADLVAWETGHHGHPDRALRLLQRLLPKAAARLGHDHRRTLGIKFAIAHWTGQTGDHAHAAELYPAVIAECTRALGEDDRLTISARDAIAYEFGESGHHDRAIEYMRVLLDHLEKRDHHPHDVWGTRYRLAYWTTAAKRYPEALYLWEHLVAEARERFGRLNLRSLNVREEHACCVGDAGDAATAARMLKEVLADASELPDPPSTNILGLRRQAASWVGEAGDPAEAVRRLQDLVTTATELRGTEDGWTLALRRHLAHWIGKSGDPSEAVRRLDELIAVVKSHDRLARSVQESLDHWRAIAASAS